MNLGDRFGRLAVLSIEADGMASVICDCGQIKTVRTLNLRHGGTRSCGCLRRETTSARRTKHGLTGTREFRAWSHMRGRCNTRTTKHFERWGGRGIGVCSRWDDFETFLSDMGTCPPGYSIDRIDNDGPYSPENCRWADQKTQVNNTSSNVRIEHKGRTQTIAQWAEELGLRYATLYRRLVVVGESPAVAFRRYLTPGKKAV